MDLQEKIQEMSNQIMEHRSKILDEFCKAYLASFDEKYFLQLKKDDFRRLKMVIQVDNETLGQTKQTIHFELKKGRLPKNTLISTNQ
jgi:hypothetical protein